MSDIAEVQKAASRLRPLMLPGSAAFAITYAGFFSTLILLGLITLPFNPFLAVGGGAAFAAVMCMAIATVAPRATYLEFDHDRFTRCLFFRKLSVAWKDVTGIRADWFASATFPIAWNRQVLVDFRAGGVDDTLSFFPHQFGLSDDQALDLLTPYLENVRYRSLRPQDEAVAA